MAAVEEETRHLVQPESPPPPPFRKVAKTADARRKRWFSRRTTPHVFIAVDGKAPPLLAHDPCWPPAVSTSADGKAPPLLAHFPLLWPPADDDHHAPSRVPEPVPPVSWVLPTAHKEAEVRTSTRRTSAWPPRRPWLPLPSFPRPDGMHRVKHDPFRSALPGRLEQLALDRKMVMDCLNLYNSQHPDDEYEPAPGLVTQHGKFVRDGSCWTHGNFVARRKRSGCFSFLPAPRTIFFFELVTREDFDGVVTCVPLDEPVTEAYNFLGFSLGWRSRRDGSADKICKTCYRCCEDRPGSRKPFPCGHDSAEIVCKMCYLVSCVLHPYPGEFAFGYRSY